jgi:cellulose synthase operon protein C
MPTASGPVHLTCRSTDRDNAPGGPTRGMPPGPDGDDEELIEIDLEPDGPPPLPPAQVSELAPELVVEAEDTEPNRIEVEAAPEIPDAIEVPQPMAEAAEGDPVADLALFEAEAAVADGGRRAALLVEVARLKSDPPEAALPASRAAFAADPSMPLALWPLRRLLAQAGLWAELAEVLDLAARSRPAGADPVGRADLLVERGRLLEDRLQREPEAIACFREALSAVPDHRSALLSLWLVGVRRGEAVLTAGALGGLARLADTPTRRAALAIEEARAWRVSPLAVALERALTVLEEELGRADPDLPLGSLLVELDALTRDDLPPEIIARALERLVARIAPVDPTPMLAVALLRERARVLLRQAAPEAALEALNQAGRLDPAHPLVAAERLELAVGLDRLENAGEIARAFVAAARSDDEAVDLALAYAETAIRVGRAEAAAQILQTARVQSCRSARVDLRAFELAIAVRRRDAGALADAFAAEAQAEADPGPGLDLSGDLRWKASALCAAGAIRGAALGDAASAEDFYRRALASAGASSTEARPALQALLGLLTSGGRTDEAAALLEATLTAPPPGDGPGGGRTLDETWARESLVSLYADELGSPGRAVAHQRRLVALAPHDVNRRIRLCDLDLESVEGDRLSAEERAANLIALGAAAGDPSVSVALRVAAGRTLAAAKDPEDRARGVALLRDLAGADVTGLASSALERASTPGEARAEVVAAELGAPSEEAAPDAVRALRFRLAHHYAAGGRYPEALAALTPLRSEGDPLARAWSYELARRSGEAILEVAVLSEETRARDGVLGDEPGVLLADGEALARAGDPQGAAASFRLALGLAPTGETAGDAALALFRLAAADAATGARALPEALEALAVASAEAPALAISATREAALARAATGEIAPADLEARAPPDAPARERAEVTLLRFMAGARQGDAGVVAEALVEIAQGLADPAGGLPAEAVALLGRAAARARLAGPEIGEAVAITAWQASRRPALAPALSDLPVPGGGSWPETRPDPRRARARRTGGATGSALDLEVALDAERRGALGAALAAYGSVIAVDPDRVEAWTGVRRVARAGGDLLGEARALVRLGALISNPERAAALFVEAAGAYERSGRTDDAIAALARAVELRPDDVAVYSRVHALLRADLDAQGRALAFDGLLSYRLAAASLGPGERIALLFERAEHRLSTLGDRAAAFDDFKQILKIDPQHLASIYKLAYGAIADRDFRATAHWLERYLALVGGEDEERAAVARLDLAASYEADGQSGRAVEALRRAAMLRPADPRPTERLSELHLRRGEIRDAVEALREAELHLPTARAQAALQLRIGEILRDVGRDPGGAAAAFRRAADLEPLGAGVATLIALADVAGDARGALETVDREVADLRRVLAASPLDARRLERLATFLDLSRSRGGEGALPEAAAAVESVRQLAESRLPSAPPSPAGRIAPKAGRAFISELADPAAGGFVSEVWPHLVDVAAAIFPAPASRARRTAADANPSLAWIAPTAAAIGLPRVPIYLQREAGAPLVGALEDPDPALLLSADALSSAATHFYVGRALGLLALRATVLERTSADDLAPLFACAAILAGAAPPAGLPRPTEALQRDVARAISRKDRKALTLQASRFGFEAFDLAAWRQAVLYAANRFGLFAAGDPAVAAIALAGGAKVVAGNPAALDLLAFALSERYPALKRAAPGLGG